MFTQGFCFDDVLLIPKHSRIKSRADVDLSVTLPKNISLKIPIISANMKSVTDVNMAVAIASLGGLPILHRFDDYEKLVNNWVSANSKGCGVIGASVGIKKHDRSLVKDLYQKGCRVICVDVAHGDHDDVCSFVADIREQYQDLLIIAGNVVTTKGANNLWIAGADIIKIGVGSGSICSTRIETGNGYPQLSALNNVCNGDYDPRDLGNKLQWPMFIADGGIRSAGDCVKSLAFADLVMIGNLFAGTDETPGEVITTNGQKFKRYEGSSTYKPNHVEGVVGLVPYRGPVSVIVKKITEGIRSGCSYQGVNDLTELKTNPEFVIISNAGLTESRPHSVIL